MLKEQLELSKKIVYWYKHFGQGKPYFYYSGAAGTGKTTVIRYVIEELDIEDLDFFVKELPDDY